MLSGILSFIGGGAFRAIWGEVASFVSKQQDHKHELEAMQIQADIADKVHAREMDRLRLANELKVNEIRVQGETDIELAEIESFTKGLQVLNQKTGIAFVDGWNGIIRPAFASFALLLWAWSIGVRGFILTPFDLDLIAGIAGFFFANRELGKRK